jgi:hypothetical protein
MTTIGEALGNAIAGYRDKDNDRCAVGLVAVVAALRELEDSNERLRRAKDLFFQNAEAWETRALLAEAELTRLRRSAV